MFGMQTLAKHSARASWALARLQKQPFFQAGNGFRLGQSVTRQGHRAAESMPASSTNVETTCAFKSRSAEGGLLKLQSSTLGSKPFQFSLGCDSPSKMKRPASAGTGKRTGKAHGLFGSALLQPSRFLRGHIQSWRLLRSPKASKYAGDDPLTGFVGSSSWRQV